MSDMKFMFALTLFVCLTFTLEILMFPEIVNPLNATEEEMQRAIEKFGYFEDYSEWNQYEGSTERKDADDSLGFWKRLIFEWKHGEEYRDVMWDSEEEEPEKKTVLSRLDDIKKILTFDIPEETGMPTILRPIIAVPIWLCVAYLVIKVISGLIPFVGGVK